MPQPETPGVAKWFEEVLDSPVGFGLQTTLHGKASAPDVPVMGQVVKNGSFRDSKKPASGFTIRPHDIASKYQLTRGFAALAA
jgi:hypothetical protein